MPAWGLVKLQSLVSLLSFVTVDILDWSALSCFAFNKASYAQAVINTNVGGNFFMTTGLLIIGVIIIGVVALRLFSKSGKLPVDKGWFIGTMATEDFVNKYNSNSGQVKGGSLCFYGHWFGRPYDNYHQVKSLTFDKDRGLLIMDFNEGERLTITNPANIKEYKNQLTIDTADKISWTWYSYGKPQTKENLFFIDIEKSNGQVNGKSNVNWHIPDFKDLSLKKPALLWT